MIRVLSVEHVAKIVNMHGLDNVLKDTIQQLKLDFANWAEFDKIPRPAFHVKDGVIELMPTADKTNFAFKYVNGHPKNPESGKQTVVGTGQLSRVEDGYPLLMSEMTLLTGIRTAATSALATSFLARENSTTLALIGTGAQSDFQLLAAKLVREITTVRYFDIDPEAMDRFERNMSDKGFEMVRCSSAKEAVQGADIITVCTACKAHVDVLENSWIMDSVHINGLGGDCPGKTELEASILERTKNVVEFFDQSFIEGEIQRFSESKARELVHAELWELVTKQKLGRENANEITMFDSVGFALEDFSVLKLFYKLAERYDVGAKMNMVPDIKDPKDLYSVLR